MALTSRISLKGSEPAGPEDYLSTSLGVIFPDDVTNQHGDAEHSLIYASPHLPKPLYLELAEPTEETDRRLFSHFLWNSSLLLAELIERDTLGVADSDRDEANVTTPASEGVSFDVRGKSIMELGAGTALPSMMGGLLGAERVVVTDYPASAVIKTLKENIARNIKPELSPPGCKTTEEASIIVEGHSWGELTEVEPLCPDNQHAFDRIIVADCLWMPWQHANLHRSISYFLKKSKEARCWVVAGFHTGREKMRGFFEKDALAEKGLAVERIWERDCDGVERAWSWDRDDDVTIRKRWLTVCELKRVE